MKKAFPQIPPPHTHTHALLGKEEPAFGLSYLPLLSLHPSFCCISFPQRQEQATIFPSMPLLDVLDYNPHHSLALQSPGSFLHQHHLGRVSTPFQLLA